ncbi:MAG: WxcM-like domain-containing protein [Lachnospiraceae bacterium]|nr:WxcM-like domain-containing protein [Lachnospiraceae bacterium]
MNSYYAGVKMLPFRKFNDGGVIRVEGLRDVPFEIKRVFYIYGQGNVGKVRGKHSNRKSEFVLFNVKGTSKVKTIDENLNEKVYELNEPGQGIYLPRMVWKEMYDFSEDSVLMVLSNEYYDAGEYIRNFDDFVQEMRHIEAEEAWNNE